MASVIYSDRVGDKTSFLLSVIEFMRACLCNVVKLPTSAPVCVGMLCLQMILRAFFALTLRPREQPHRFDLISLILGCL